MSKEELVYSTASGRQKEASPSKKRAAALPQKGPCKMRLEKKGRGGKQVTVLFNLPLSAEEATGLMRQLQEALACGATFKDGVIELRGDMRTRVAAFFARTKTPLLGA